MTAAKVAMRIVAGSIAIAALGCAAAGSVLAQTYPSRPVRVVVPFAAGGATDVVARVVSQKLADAFGQQVVVDNRAGGSAIIGTDIVAKALPDGYTVLVTANPHTVNPALFAKLPFDPVRDFAPVSLAGLQPLLLVVHPSLAAKSVAEVIALFRANPGKYAYGTSGTGGPQHLAGELFRTMAGVDIVHVPYKGAAPATVDLIAGQVQFAFGGATNVLPHVKAGRLRALATASAARTPFAPELPTLADSGLPGFESTAWLGALVPARTPTAVVERLHAEMARALKSQEVRDRLFAQGIEAVGNSPKEFGEFIRAELVRWGKVVRDAGIKPE